MLSQTTLGGAARLAMSLHVLGQWTWEIVLIAWLGSYCPRGWFFRVYWAGISGLLCLQWVDIFLYRLLDLPLLEVFKLFIVKEYKEVIILFLEASGIPLWAWVLAAFLLLMCPWMGYELYTRLRVSYQCSSKQLYWMGMGIFFIPLSLSLVDLSYRNLVPFHAYVKVGQLLPWKQTPFTPICSSISFNDGPRSLKSADHRALRSVPVQPRLELPNIYLFVIESLRCSAIDPKWAPYLSQFREATTHSEITLASGNATPISWFSLFHAELPLKWANCRGKEENQGSLPLTFLKKQGYTIHVYGAADFRHYHIDTLLFGPDCCLIDDKVHMSASLLGGTANADVATLDWFTRQRGEHPEWHRGQVFIFFWDGTHFPYDWGSRTPSFIEAKHPIWALSPWVTSSIKESLWNRYRNAVACIDRLFGAFLYQVQYEKDAVIAVVGDHGEEFFEKGHLFHGSHLVQEQTEVPLWLQLGTLHPQQVPGVSSHIDVWPTILDHIFHLSGACPWDGVSLLKSHRPPYVVIGQYYGGLPPREFCLHQGAMKVVLRFDPSEVGKFWIRSLTDRSDEPIPCTVSDIHHWVDVHFRRSLEDLFPCQDHSLESIWTLR